jgi:hypothetical protein
MICALHPPFYNPNFRCKIFQLYTKLFPSLEIIKN